MPHEHPDDGGCTGWGCIGCLVAFAISIAAMLWLIHVALVAGVPYRP
jgi:hypothetical protein